MNELNKNDLNKNKKSSIWNIFNVTAIGLYFLLVYLSIFTTLVSFYIGGIAVYLIYYLPVLFLIFTIVKKGDKNNSAQLNLSFMLFWFTIFSLVYAICFQFVSAKLLVNSFASANIELNTFQLIAIIPAFLLSFYLLRLKPTLFTKKLSWLVIIMLLIDIIFTLELLSRNPNASKILSTPYAFSVLGLTGASGFNITYSAVFLIPLFIFGITKSKGWYRFFWAILTAINFIFIYMCGYMLAIIASALIVMLYLFFSLNGTVKFLLFIPMLFLVYMAFNTDVIYDILIALSKNIKIYEVSARFRDIANMVKFGDTSAASLGRLDLYENSFQAFLKSPIVGIFPYQPDYELSRHSTLLDILGGTGLLGFIPFCLSIYFAFKSAITYVLNKKYHKCIYCVYITFIFLIIFNPVLATPSIVFTVILLVPLMSILFKEKNNI